MYITQKVLYHSRKLPLVLGHLFFSDIEESYTRGSTVILIMLLLLLLMSDDDDYDTVNDDEDDNDIFTVSDR